MTLQTRLTILVSILLVGLGGQTLLARKLNEFDQVRPSGPTRPLAEIPYEIDGWVGKDEPPLDEILDMLKLDDYVQRVYRHPSGEQVILWISHSATSRDAYHYPTVCMQGHGWSEEEAERTRVRVPIAPLAVGDHDEERSVEELRFRFAKEGGVRQYVYYWYYLIGESPIDQAMRQMSKTTRLFLRGRTNGSVTVEVFSQSTEPDAEKIDSFAKQVAIELDRLLPPSTRAECELGANL